MSMEEHKAILPHEVEDCPGYNNMADWYSFGIVLFQMMTVQFLEECRLIGFRDFSLDHDAEDIIEKLICEDPDKRLGAASVIRDHPFFWSMDWERLESLKIPPPSIPSKPSKKSLPHLVLEELMPTAPSACESPISSVHQELFQGFSFKTFMYLSCSRAPSAPSFALLPLIWHTVPSPICSLRPLSPIQNEYQLISSKLW